MQHKDVFVLENIIEFCNKIKAITDRIGKDYGSFIQNYETQDLVCFYLLQIGETANSLSNQFKENNDQIEWHKIIALRNIVAHEYGNIKPEIVWNTIQDKIPELLSFCKSLIS